MPKIAGFTDLQIKNRMPSKMTPYRIFEKSTDRGFHIQVLPSGVKQFGLYRKQDGKQRFYNLGDYSTQFTLALAREKCRHYNKLLNDGIDPRVYEAEIAEKTESKRQALALAAKAPTIDDLLDYYLNTLENERTRKNITQQFKTDVRPFIGKIKAHQLSETDAAAVINRVVRRGANRSARNLYIALNAAFNRARKNLEFNLKGWSNPLDDVDKPKEGDPTDRALSVEEIKNFWQALDKYTGMSPSLKNVLQLLILTGQRVKDIIELEWPEVNLSGDSAYLDLTISRTKTGKKTRRGHIVPLPSMSKEILKKQLHTGKAVFSGKSDPDVPMHWQSLTKALARMLETTNIEHFSPRDIRTTVKTHMARIKVLKEIRDRIQNHALHDVASKHYDRHDYYDEKLDGLERWQSELERLLGNVGFRNI